VPGIEFWVCFSPAPLLVPTEVDLLLIGLERATSPHDVQRWASDVVPPWKQKAAGRPVTLLWTSVAPQPPGRVPECQPETLKACADVVERYGLAGIVFDNYGGYPEMGGLVGIETNPTLVSAIETISKEWGIHDTGPRAADEAGQPAVPVDRVPRFRTRPQPTTPPEATRTPSQLVVGGAKALREPSCQEWLLGLVRSDVMPLVDAINTHPMYGASPQYPDAREYYCGYASLVRRMKQEAAAHGFKGEWIAEEMCWTTAKNPSVHDPWQYTEIVAAKYYARAIVMHLGMDVRAGIGGDYSLDPMLRVVQNLCTVMAGNKPTTLQLEIQNDAGRMASYTFSLPNRDRLIALWNDNAAVDHDRGESSTLIVKGFAARKVTAIDVLYSSEQEMKTETEGRDLIIRNLLVKDYPIILRLTPAF